MKAPLWVYGLSRCSSCRRLHVARSRHPEAPMPERTLPHGEVGMGQRPSIDCLPKPRQTRQERPPRRSNRGRVSGHGNANTDAVAIVLREAFAGSISGHLRQLAESRRDVQWNAGGPIAA